MSLVFQYGSNTSSRRLNSEKRLAGEALVVGLAHTLEPYQLDFTVWSRQNGCAAADIAPGAGRTIWGVLYRIPAHRIERRGAGRNYVRVPIDVRLADGALVSGEVITYVVRQRRDGLVTSLAYARHIIEGLREHDAPAEYLDYVKQRIICNNATLEPLIRSL